MQNLESALSERREAGLYRERQILDSPQEVRVRISGQQYLSFCSNDYLGLANHPEVRKSFIEGVDRFGVGSGAAHLITGHSYAHQVLEEELAEFVERPRALVFSTGYMANLGVIDALLNERAVVFEDRLNHASLLDGARISGARLHRYRHNDPDALSRKLHQSAIQANKLIATDAVFSMDGDCAELKSLYGLANTHQSWLLVDDAHGFGVLGKQGRGWCFDQLAGASANCILMATLGKACGTFGAFVAGSEALIETLIQHARSYIYTTAPPPALAWATREALRQLRNADDRRAHLQSLIRQFVDGAGSAGLPVTGSTTAIQPLVVGDSARAAELSARLRERGILVTAIRPPTVPEGTARLRITLSAAHTRDDIDYLLENLRVIVPGLMQ